VTGRNRTLAVVGAVVAVVLVAVVAVLLTSGGDAPEELDFDDAASTTTSADRSTTTTAAGAAAATDGRWTITDRSQAGYRVLEDRLGGVQNIEAVGRTNQVTGGFEVAGTTVSDVEVVVDVASITSDSGLRDGQFRGRIMSADQFPTATFTIAAVELDEVPEEGATASVPVTGELTLRGTTREVTTTLEVRRLAGEVQILGSIPVTFADFGIETPSPPGLSVRDEGTVEFLVVAVPEPGTSG
jgi:polyisoprenoid-binding protein YceI